MCAELLPILAKAVTRKGCLREGAGAWCGRVGLSLLRDCRARGLPG